MENPEKPKRSRGRPPKEGRTEKVVLAVDEATCLKLDALIEYGGFGTGRSEIVMFILRLWLREKEDKLKAEIASKFAPFGSKKAQQT
jgi:hypothetical protein